MALPESEREAGIADIGKWFRRARRVRKDRWRSPSWARVGGEGVCGQLRRRGREGWGRGDRHREALARWRRRRGSTRRRL